MEHIITGDDIGPRIGLRGFLREEKFLPERSSATTATTVIVFVPIIYLLEHNPTIFLTLLRRGGGPHAAVQTIVMEKD